MNEPEPRRDSLAGLRIPYVRPFMAGRMCGTVGAQFVSVAVGWELYERTHDPWALGLVGMVQVIPAMLLMLPAGNVADRFPRRSVGLVAQSILALASLGLALVSYLQLPVELVYALLALSGVGRAFAGPSTQTILAQLLSPKEYGLAFAWQVSSGHMASIGGPALAGALIALTGAAAPSYVAGTLCQIAFMLVLLRLPSIAPTPGAVSRKASDLFAGVAFIKRSQIYLAAITLDLFAVLLGGAVALLPVYAKDILMVGPVGLGVLRSAPSLGAMLSALLVTRFGPWQRPGRVMMLVVAGFGIATIGFGLSRSMALSLACLFFVGAFDSVSMVIRGTLQQAITPDRLRGRVAAVGQLFVGLSNEMGAFESGATASLFGPVASVVGGGIGTLVVVVLAAFAWPAMLRLGPLHTLRPIELEELPATLATAEPEPAKA